MARGRLERRFGRILSGVLAGSPRHCADAAAGSLAAVPLVRLGLSAAVLVWLVGGERWIAALHRPRRAGALSRVVWHAERRAQRGAEADGRGSGGRHQA